MDQYVTCESVTEGHPDKVCDQVSDGILDEYLKQDPNARVAVETMVSGNTMMIAGEVTSSARVDAAATARKIIREIGYTDPVLGFDCDSCMILTNLSTQSPDIAMGVGQYGKPEGTIGAGDQGMMFGYACDETENYMPLAYDLANRIVRKLAEVRKTGVLPWLRPDGKSQVTIRYGPDGEPSEASCIIVSAQHDETVSLPVIRREIREKVIRPAVGERWLTKATRVYINPTGRFVLGGPAGDTGLTGRKIMVDTYGGVGRHGGGAFSGKDPTKVDRSASYMARYAAKNLVAAGLARKCEVELDYAIGVPEPVSVSADLFGTQTIPQEEIERLLGEVFSFSVANLLEQLDLKRPQYRKLAAYGHFGREDGDFRWERLDKVPVLREQAVSGLRNFLSHTRTENNEKRKGRLLR